MAEISPVSHGHPPALARSHPRSGAAWRSRTAARDQRLAHGRRIAAHAAGDPSASIIDFAFSPASLTIHVGDSITWTNTGKAPHTATARGGSFSTGILKTGQSASHTFTTAGTFAYYCTVHPFMHGTVVVLANAASSTPTTPSTTTTPPSSSTPSTSSPATSTPAVAAAGGPSLPNTGIDVGATAAIGIALLGLGAALRRERAPKS